MCMVVSGTNDIKSCVEELTRFFPCVEEAMSKEKV